MVIGITARGEGMNETDLKTWLDGMDATIWQLEHQEVEERQDEFIKKIIAAFARKDALLREVIEYTIHENDCILSQMEAGKPTEDGYQLKYAGKWYPVTEKPKCQCGLDDLITRIRKELGE